MYSSLVAILNIAFLLGYLTTATTSQSSSTSPRMSRLTSPPNIGSAPTLANVGAEPIFGGDVNRLILGEVEELWDVVAVVRYPSRKAMFNMATSDEYMESEKHRIAGLAGQLNIEVTEDGFNFK